MNNNYLKNRIGSNLYKIRNQLNIKQSELEAEGIIKQSHLSKIENGELNISAIMLYKLSKRYNVDINIFFN
jgi:Helix-turn-helix.